MKNIPYGRQQILDADIHQVVEVLKSDYLTQGPQVELFEKEFAEYVGAPYAVAVANGTAALHLAALALGVQPGDRVLVVSNTFVASANCIRFCGGEVEFVDLDPQTLCISLEALARRIEEMPRGHFKGIVAVDFAGYALDFAKLQNLAKTHGLWTIEDACHALGAEFHANGKTWTMAGSGKFSDVAVFSFHPVKHIATGEGGMITTGNRDLAERLRRLRAHGITRNPAEMGENHGGWYYEMQDLGFNYRLPDILCALGRSQLSRIRSNLGARRALAKTYDAELRDSPLELPSVPDSVRHAYHLYVIRTEKRDRLYAFLKERGICAQVHYIPVHTQPYYHRRYGDVRLPNTELYYTQALSLPMFHALTSTDQDRVVETLREFFR